MKVPVSVAATVAVTLPGLFALGTAAAQEAGAAGTSMSGPQALDDVWWTGSLFAATPATLPRGLLVVEPYLLRSVTYGRFDSNWAKHGAEHSAAYRSITGIMYGVTDKLLVAMLPRFGYNDVRGAGNSGQLGVGDTTVRLQYCVSSFREGSPIPTVSVLVDETFPSGKYDALGAHPSSGLGSGAYTTTFSLYSQYIFRPHDSRLLRTRLNVSYGFADGPVRLRDVSVYGTAAGFRGEARPGATVGADLAFEYSLTRNWVPALDVTYQHDGSTSVTGVGAARAALDSMAVLIRKDSGSDESISLAPAIEYNWSERIGVIVGVAATVAGRNTAATYAPVIALNMVF